MNFIFSWQKQYFTLSLRSFVKYCFATLENKIHIFAPPCNILYLYSFQKPDIGVELTGGCQGFATKFLDWPEELIVGGIVKNRTHIRRFV